MLPPGHIAAGYLAADALLKITKPDLSLHQQNLLLWWGLFFGFAPDLDMFWVFFKERAFIVKDLKNNNHRKLLSHAPLLWAIAGLVIYFFSSTVFLKYFGLMVWLGSWSHFLVDSIEYGIMWLWPFSGRKFALKDPELVLNIDESGFWKYWWKTVKLYSEFVSFYLEIAVIIFALIIYFR